MTDRSNLALPIWGLVLIVSLGASCALPAAVPQAAPAPSLAETRAPAPSPDVQPAPTTSMPATAFPISSASYLAEPPMGRESMAVHIVFDNNPLDRRLRTGWGFAAWVKVGDRVVLFDTGARGGVLLENMAALGLNPQDVDIVFLSHNHGDHTGGLAGVLSANPRVAVYVPHGFPAAIKAQLRSSGARLVEVTGPMEILPGLWTTGEMGASPAEQALVVRTVRGLVVLTGCAHPGVDRMIARAKEIGRDEVHLVLGGFHLSGASNQHIQGIVDEFRRLGVKQVAPSHCTGDAARELFRNEYGRDYHAAGVGWQWRSEAMVWEAASHGIPAQVGVATVSVARSKPDVVYLAAYEPGGLYRSADGGTTWQLVGAGLGQLAPLSVAVHPTDPEVVWAGTMAGGFRSSNGGRRWDPMPGLPQTPIYALFTAPDGRALYAGAEAAGVWRSDDGGRTWQAGELAGGALTVLSLAMAADGTLFAGTAGEGLWASDDGGVAWWETSWAQTPGYVSHLSTTPGGRLYALGDGRLYLSLDGGDSWKFVGPPDFQGLSFAAETSPAGWLYLGSKGGGLRVSSDGGESWFARDGGFHHADITFLLVDPSKRGVVYLGTRHNGLYMTADRGRSWSLASSEVGHPVVTALAQDPVDVDTFYAGTLDGVYRSVDGGETWQLISGAVGKVFVQGLAIASTGDRIYAGARTGIYLSENRGRTWRWLEEEIGPISIFNVTIDPHDQDRIYAGSWGHNILRSNDGGRSWDPIHSGLETLSVHAFALDPRDPQVLYAGTVEAVYGSSDAGRSWQSHPLAHRALTTFSLLVDPADPALLYAGTTAGVYRSTDRGQTWESCGTEDLDASVTALAFGPSGHQTLYAGTEHHGLFRSTNAGDDWQQWGLDGSSVYGILVDRSGGVWLGTDRGIFKQMGEGTAP